MKKGKKLKSLKDIKEFDIEKFRKKVNIFSRITALSVLVFFVSLMLHNYFKLKFGELSILSVLFFIAFIIGIIAMFISVGLILYYSFWKIE